MALKKVEIKDEFKEDSFENEIENKLDTKTCNEEAVQRWLFEQPDEKCRSAVAKALQVHTMRNNSTIFARMTIGKDHPYFDGNLLLEWYTYEKRFKESTETFNLSEAENVLRLGIYLKG